MLRVESRVEIRRPPHQVFSYLSEPSNWTQWLEGIVESRQEGDGSFGLGSKVQLVIKFLGRRFDIAAEVIEYQKDMRIRMHVLSGPFPMDWIHMLEAAGEASRLTTRLEVDPGSYFMIAGPLLKQVVQRHFDADHAALKALLEAQVQAKA